MPDSTPQTTPEVSPQWPQVGDTVYIAEYGHGARRGKLDNEIRWNGTPYFSVLLDGISLKRGVYHVYCTAAEAEEVSR